MYKLDEIGADLYRISIYVPEINLQFNHFLVRDEEPLLFHTGLRRMFPLVREAVGKVIDPARLRWISFSHFESDECGALNQWLAIAPQAQPATGMVGALVNLSDYADRPARVLAETDVLATGKYRFRYISTPQLPHGWDAGVMFEETQGVLLCSDLFHHNGDVEPLTRSSVLDKVRDALTQYQAGPLADYMPYTPRTGKMLRRLAALKPRRLAIMHGSSYEGNGEQALLDLAGVMRDTLGEDEASSDRAIG